MEITKTSEKNSVRHFRSHDSTALPRLYNVCVKVND